MTSHDLLMLAVQVLIFACGMAMLSHRFFAAHKIWLRQEFIFKSHLPGIVGCALMLFAILSAASLGWLYVFATLLAGFTVAYLYVYILRLRIEAGLLGPVLAVLSILLTVRAI